MKTDFFKKKKLKTNKKKREKIIIIIIIIVNICAQLKRASSQPRNNLCG